ncbi:hypothetical protein KY495_13665 [Massilia sp. PAMC28688]|uniref:hypothetical protein n=1 Tax=Massilia sp. PAMC28688 TaxID=2861283 RepID=UPI001C62E850|nr:hypothetical protein [Massilia sp. PAMC28688]QYF91835.1 hypothetical protein KY495_13665 [Massilia sp. PAMC28688]
MTIFRFDLQRAITHLSLAGTLMFAAALLISYVRPHLVEAGMREVIRVEVEHRTGERVEALINSRIISLAERALGHTDDQLSAARERIRRDVPARVAHVVADMTRADCECRRRLVAAAETSEERQLRSLLQVRERLTGLIESAYAHVSASLQREFRVFAASNAVAFAVMGLVAVARRGATLQLLLPAVALTGAMVITASVYLFQQNWLHTIVFSDYVGLAYGAWLAVVALLLADVLLNRARLTTRLLNVMFNVAGAALKAVPC